MADVIQIRRDTAALWTSANPTLASGELGLETDTGKIKIGDGSTAWTSLAYYTELNRFDSDTISENTTLDADTHYLVGKGTIINNGITLIIPVDSLLEDSVYTSGKAL